MRTVSTSALVRQVRREGGRLHLHPLVVDGKCFVAQRAVGMRRAGPLGAIKAELVPVCSIDPQHPLRNVARYRRRRWEHDRRRLYAQAAQRRRAAMLSALEPKLHTLKNDARQLVRVLGRDALTEVLRGLPHAR